MVLSPTRSAVEAVHGLSADVPVVVAAEGTSSADRSAIAIDQVHGSRLATAHLLDLGHRTVHHVRGPQDWLEADARVQGWSAELGARSAPIGQCLTGDWTAASGYEAGRQLAGQRDVTALFVANDQMALGVIRALSEAGRRVPEDVSVVGFDDIPEAAFFRPPLTTVRHDFAEVGRWCLLRLVALIDGEPVGTGAMIEPELVVRASTGEAPAH